MKLDIYVPLFYWVFSILVSSVVFDFLQQYQYNELFRVKSHFYYKSISVFNNSKQKGFKKKIIFALICDKISTLNKSYLPICPFVIQQKLFLYNAKIFATFNKTCLAINQIKRLKNIWQFKLGVLMIIIFSVSVFTI